MSYERKIICDGCGGIKQQTNHWFYVDAGNSGFRIYQWREDASITATLHLCGQKCVTKKLSEWMTGSYAN